MFLEYKYNSFVVSDINVFFSVLPGKTVVTWQFVFACEQHGHRAEFNSNILADSRSPSDVPGAIAGAGF